MAGSESATLIAEVRENRRGVDAANSGIDTLHAILTSMAKANERSGVLLEQVTALVIKSDARWKAVAENTEAMSRMLQLHTGLLDRTAVQVDALIAPAPAKKRGKRT